MWPAGFDPEIVWPRFPIVLRLERKCVRKEENLSIMFLHCPHGYAGQVHFFADDA